MVNLTRQQRHALFGIYKRGPIRPCTRQINLANALGIQGVHFVKPLTYRQFRAMVQPTFGCDNAVVVPWCSMFLCIEVDGYVHS